LTGTPLISMPDAGDSGKRRGGGVAQRAGQTVCALQRLGLRGVL